ncbi:uncharacterized protein CLUP02_17553 [Colletotrichum lupini]|uniref:Uncharacterized protein n=1 Tax=Colletotrichum lupini TaxID=145971 RepID=A0A9Q8WAW2_9PEZI|nr:uncharacterized protein CLUP02_17553 [Colletotrichum lupini]UQC76042.1 hypothetical protein CLUP02_17553 [Colletotrichum lupini]
MTDRRELVYTRTFNQSFSYFHTVIPFDIGEYRASLACDILLIAVSSLYREISLIMIHAMMNGNPEEGSLYTPSSPFPSPTAAGASAGLRGQVKTAVWRDGYGRACSTGLAYTRFEVRVPA